nr:isopentenyl-diphosphate Delta-isomerase [Pantoea sp. 201603H]
MLIEKLILVDRHDNQVGEGEKLQVHLDGSLHRAFSVFIFNSNGQLLLQQRAEEKYHSAGLWANTCCGHPRPGEDKLAAARRRLQEEMGFDCSLIPVGSFIYHAQVSDNMVEYEYDHLYAGVFDGSPQHNPAEVAQYKWLDLADIRQQIATNPNSFSQWFLRIFQQPAPLQPELWWQQVRLKEAQS